MVPKTCRYNTLFSASEPRPMILHICKRPSSFVSAQRHSPSPGARKPSLSPQSAKNSSRRFITPISKPRTETQLPGLPKSTAFEINRCSRMVGRVPESQSRVPILDFLNPRSLIGSIQPHPYCACTMWRDSAIYYLLFGSILMLQPWYHQSAPA